MLQVAARLSLLRRPQGFKPRLFKSFHSTSPCAINSITLPGDRPRPDLGTFRPFVKKPVVWTDEEGQRVEFDEEPHMMEAWAAGGYAALQLGDKYKSPRSGLEFAIVSKLGWGKGSSVWLGYCRCVS